MPLSALDHPQTDPTAIFELFRGAHGTELLTVAAAHFQLFDRLATPPKTLDALRAELELEERPAVVLVTALRAMGLLEVDHTGRLSPTPIAREHLLADAYFAVSDYLGLAAESPGVLNMLERLKTNKPANTEADDDGAAFIYREGIGSAMELEANARHLTLALAGRAKNVAPALADGLDLTGVDHLLDVGGGTGIYAIACLQKNPGLRATVFDRPEVLKVATEFATQYGVTDRLTLQPGDMFADPLPDAEVALLSNVLHDWDKPQCVDLVQRCADTLPASGRVVIHDVFLSDAMDGPLPIALYSASLFSLTEGRAYSAAEYRDMLTAVGLAPQAIVPTRVHCGLLAGVKA
ncbi:MAG: methyltransferase [Planctomycetota bacterium]|jgi:predicted O-methyltransferase YrrM